MLKVFSSLSFVFVVGWALNAAAAPEKEYSCRIALVTKDIPDGFAEVDFDRPAVAPGPHGGDPIEFHFGSHTIYAQVDGRWRSMRWEKDGKLVSQVLTVSQLALDSDHVLILNNPENEDDQLSLNCDVK